MNEAGEHIKPYKSFYGLLLPNWLSQRSEISQGAKLCYGRLCQFAGKNGECYPAQKTLAEELGVAERTVRNYLKELKKHDLIEITKVGRKCCNRYKFLYHKWMESTIKSDLQETASHKVNDRHNTAGMTGRELPIHIKRIIKENIVSNDTSKGDKMQIKTPTKGMFAIFERYWNDYNDGSYLFKNGKDGKIAKQLYRQCLKDNPDEPLGLFEIKVKVIFEQYDVKEFGGISYFWNRAVPSKRPKEGGFIPIGGRYE